MGEYRPQRIFNIRRDYNAWVANETLEDYALRFAPRSFRKWSEFRVANTAFGSISFLVLEAIGGSLTITYGFSNACFAILAVGLVIFLTGFPISYYAAKYNIDMDLLTRGAGFGYIGSTLTSLIYASFTFTLFALEASIMSLALELYLDIPLAIAHLISAVVIIPLVTYGITNINRLQLWTQPLWLLLLVLPYGAVLIKEHAALSGLLSFTGNDSANTFSWIPFGAATTVAFAMIAQIGEQVDFLRFLPEKTRENRVRWWSAVIIAGPGWIVFGILRQLGGAFLAYLAIRYGVNAAHAHEPTQMFLMAYHYLTDNSQLAVTATVLLVIVSQIKINVTNAYAGSLAWSNFFSRLTHSHPGRVVWLVFNVAIALLLMELGVFNALERVLGLFSNVAIAWIGALVADLVINKPLGLSPSYIEFKRAYLPDINPVGVFSTILASLISIGAYLGLCGEMAQAFSAFLALCIAFVSAPLLAYITRGRYYLARDRNYWPEGATATDKCCICNNQFEREDNAYCPMYQGTICSLCCTLDARCRDACKPGARLEDQLQKLADRFLPKRLSPQLKLRLLQFVLLYLMLAGLTGIFVGVIYYQDILSISAGEHYYVTLLYNNFLKIYSCLTIFLGLGTWWLILNNESRQVAQEESNRQTLLLLKEIEEHRKTDAKLQQAKEAADRANQAKSRFLTDMSHEIRTPLNSILGYAQILRKDMSIPEHRRDAMAIIQNSGEHLSRLIEDILDIARIEARKFDLKRAPIDLPAFVEHMVRMFKAQAESKGLAFRCQLLYHLPRYIRGDEHRLGQILINLLANAVKFTNSGEIVLHVEYSGQVAVFNVIDTGAGIPEHQREQIFQPFSRLDNTGGNAVAGSGLGLTISKILTEIMGGELSIKNNLPQGTIFTVRLFMPELHPTTESYKGADAVEEAEIIAYSGRQRRVLIADDQPQQRELLKSVLAPLGFELLEAVSGEDCYQQALALKPDLILLDMVMCGMDGLAVTTALRKASCIASIIIVSANAFQSHRHQATAAGCDNFVAKPLQIDELLRKIKLHLSLDWVYAGQEMPINYIVAEAPMHIPPAHYLGELAEFARIGDLRGLADKLHTLATHEPQYVAFVSHLQNLSKDFRLADIKRLLNRS
ncbi:MAG TPA: ATP-binding protein [Spongiibacteraceae bacterium]|jgi:signal transduction histidine kinase/purine-cytosine permease-like protein/ActR/RegA family two-component response regulator